MAIPVPSAAPEPEAIQAAARSPQDSSAKKALENEFECTICRVGVVHTTMLSYGNGIGKEAALAVS